MPTHLKNTFGDSMKSIHAENQQLIRFENVDGIGPFVGSGTIYQFNLESNEIIHADSFRHSQHRKMPSVRSEFNHFNDNYICAYLNLDHFLSYWHDEKALLTYLKCDFKIYNIVVDECYKSNNQAIFLPKHVYSKEEVRFNEIEHFYSNKAA